MFNHQMQVSINVTLLMDLVAFKLNFVLMSKVKEFFVRQDSKNNIFDRCFLVNGSVINAANGGDPSQGMDWDIDALNGGLFRLI